MSNLIGQSLGRYHILEQLGEGGMATVYKAYDTRLETDVAVKVIRTENLTLGTMERTIKRFEREAKALARLTHPNIVKVMDYGEFDGKPYLVMEYLPGGTLKERIKQGQISWQDTIRLLLPIAHALEYAHEHNLVHRDVKPSNILLTEKDQPMLSDFGVAKLFDLEDTQDLTGTGMGIGTPEYMAPEQVTAKTVDHRADIYALGIVFYEMVTGRRPFQADTPLAVLFKHATEALPYPTQFVPNLPEKVEKFLVKALAKKPNDRYQSMEKMAHAMELIGGAELASKPQPVPAKRKTQTTPTTPKTLDTLATVDQPNIKATINGSATSNGISTPATKSQPVPAKHKPRRTRPTEKALDTLATVDQQNTKATTDESTTTHGLSTLAAKQQVEKTMKQQTVPAKPNIKESPKPPPADTFATIQQTRNKIGAKQNHSTQIPLHDKDLPAKSKPFLWVIPLVIFVGICLIIGISSSSMQNGYVTATNTSRPAAKIPSSSKTPTPKTPISKTPTPKPPTPKPASVFSLTPTKDKKANLIIYNGIPVEVTIYLDGPEKRTFYIPASGSGQYSLASGKYEYAAIAKIIRMKLGGYITLIGGDNIIALSSQPFWMDCRSGCLIDPRIY